MITNSSSAPLHHLVYSSTAPVELADSVLAELLHRSRQRNLGRRITGVLLYQDMRFLQVIEGPEADVRTLYRRIALDRRHYALTVLSDGPIARRLFAGWSMGFAVPSPSSFARFAGYLAPAQLPPLAPRAPADSGLLGLIQEFIQTAEVFL